MDTVVLGGVEYTRAAIVAKQFRYTSDYIGQLCRAKKVDARLVGRTWYVTVSSVESYKKVRHQKPAHPVTAGDTADTVPTTKAVSKNNTVAARLKSVTLKNLADKTLLQNQSDTQRLRVSYEPDDGNLIPVLKKKHTKPKYIVIEAADSKKLNISAVGAAHSFLPDEVPEVALSGKLAVSDCQDEVPPEILSESQTDDALEDARINEKNIYKNKDISDERENIATPESKSESVASSAQTVHVTVIEKGPGAKKSAPVKIHKNLPPMNLPIGEYKQSFSTEKSLDVKTVVDANQSPGVNIPSGNQFAPKSVRTAVPTSPSFLVRISPLIATFVAIICVGIIFSATMQTVVSTSEYSSQITFQIAHLLELVQW